MIELFRRWTGRVVEVVKRKDTCFQQILMFEHVCVLINRPTFRLTQDTTLDTLEQL